MGQFHRLTAPAYGALRTGDDYINNATSGTPALVAGQVSSGVNSGTYFFAFSDQATTAALNRGLQALSQNTDYLDDTLAQTIVNYQAADAALQSQLTAFEAALAATATPGDSLVGADVKTANSKSLAAGTVQSQLTALIGMLSDLSNSRTIAAPDTVDGAGYRDATIFMNPTGGSTGTLNPFGGPQMSLQLPNPATSNGRGLWLVDKSGLLSETTPILLLANGGEKIEGLAQTYPLSTPAGRWRVTSDGTDWFVFNL